MTLEYTDQAGRLEDGADKFLDATGLACPMPLLKVRQALAGLSTGQSLHVCCTDPGSWRDFASFAAHGAHRLASRRQDGDRYHYVLIKHG